MVLSVLQHQIHVPRETTPLARLTIYGLVGPNCLNYRRSISRKENLQAVRWDARLYLRENVPARMIFLAKVLHRCIYFSLNQIYIHLLIISPRDSCVRRYIMAPALYLKLEAEALLHASYRDRQSAALLSNSSSPLRQRKDRRCS
jgi:hypothetical protein